MSDYDEEWLDIVRREAGIVAGQRQHPTILVCTSYDKKKHAIKGILMPHGVESGWVSLPANHVGNGWGVIVGPKPGDAEKLDGDMFHIAFLSGDPNTPIAIARHFVVDDKNNPPEVESGEILMKHEDGQSIFMDKDKNMTVTGAKKQTVLADKDGHLTASLDGGNKMHLDQDGSGTLVDKDGSGIVYVNSGKVMLGDKGASLRVMLENGQPAQNVYAKAG